jgi:uncharacterized protein (DUF488 family)
VGHTALVTFPLVSVGYEGRDAQDLVERVAKAGVDVLVDVRLTPLSRKPGLSKRRLAAALDDVGVRYLHLPQLGNPKDNRDRFRSGDPVGLTTYRDIVQEGAGRSAVDRVADLLDSGCVALLCFERDHSTCHRSVVAEELAALDPALAVVRL